MNKTKYHTIRDFENPGLAQGVWALIKATKHMAYWFILIIIWLYDYYIKL